MPDNSDSVDENIIESNSCTVISLKCKSCEHAKHLQSKCMQKWINMHCNEIAFDLNEGKECCWTEGTTNE